LQWSKCLPTFLGSCKHFRVQKCALQTEHRTVQRGLGNVGFAVVCLPLRQRPVPLVRLGTSSYFHSCRRCWYDFEHSGTLSLLHRNSARFLQPYREHPFRGIVSAATGQSFRRRVVPPNRGLVFSASTSVLCLEELIVANLLPFPVTVLDLLCSHSLRGEVSAVPSVASFPFGWVNLHVEPKAQLPVRM
jgi:hypothetical protein